MKPIWTLLLSGLLVFLSGSSLFAERAFARLEHSTGAPQLISALQDQQPGDPPPSPAASPQLDPSPTLPQPTPEPTEAPRGRPTRTPRPTGTPIPLPPPSDPQTTNLMIGFVFVAVLVVFLGVWFNRSRIN